MDKRPSREKSKNSRKSPYSRRRIQSRATFTTFTSPSDQSTDRRIPSRKRRLDTITSSTTSPPLGAPSSPSGDTTIKSRKRRKIEEMNPITSTTTSPPLGAPSSPSGDTTIKSRKRRLMERKSYHECKRRKIEEMNPPSECRYIYYDYSPNTIDPPLVPFHQQQDYTSCRNESPMDWYDSDVMLNNIPAVIIPSHPFIFNPDSNAYFQYSAPSHQLFLTSSQQQRIEPPSMLLFLQPEDASWRREIPMDCSEDVFAPTPLDMPNPYFTIGAPSAPSFPDAFIFGNTTQTPPAIF